MTANGPALLNDHQVEIVDGKITLRFAGSATTDLPRVFESEEEASDFLAETIKTSKVLTVIGTMSCGYPKEFGRPDFSYEAFMRSVMAKLQANGTLPVRR